MPGRVEGCESGLLPALHDTRRHTPGRWRGRIERWKRIAGGKSGTVLVASSLGGVRSGRARALMGLPDARRRGDGPVFPVARACQVVARANKTCDVCHADSPMAAGRVATENLRPPDLHLLPTSKDDSRAAQATGAKEPRRRA